MRNTVTVKPNYIEHIYIELPFMSNYFWTQYISMRIYSKNCAYIEQKYQQQPIYQMKNTAEVPSQVGFPLGRSRSSAGTPLKVVYPGRSQAAAHSPYRDCAIAPCTASHRHPLAKNEPDPPAMPFFFFFHSLCLRHLDFVGVFGSVALVASSSVTKENRI